MQRTIKIVLALFLLLAPLTMQQEEQAPEVEKTRSIDPHDLKYIPASPSIDEANEIEKEIVDGFTSEDRDFIEKTSEKFSFNTDVTRLMDIIINSLYTNKEVFIRELISNASDACDKARFMAIQNPDFLGDQKNLEVRVELDPEAKTFTIIDTGIGMSKNDLVKNLGTIAKSGTTSFIEAISKGNSLNLIGQFGVGFYSTYLVSNKVVVTSRAHNDDQYVWVSTAGSYFNVAKDPRGNTLGRGTRVTLYLKEDSYEFSETDTIRKNIKKYSEFINYPIYLKVNKTFTREEEIPEEPKNETVSEEPKNDDLEVTDEKKEEKEEKKTRSVTDWRWEWELINENKPIWLKDKSEVTEEEYNKFYKALTKDSDDPFIYEHGKTEGEVNFKYILYIPAKRPYDLFENYYGKQAALKLYVRRVLVNEQFEELMPRYMNFVKGIVDSDDLPLNVSREQLQQHKMIKVMSTKLVRTAIRMMMKLAVKKEAEDDEDEEDEEDVENTGEEKKVDEKKKEENKYNKLWENFGKNIKLGVIEDSANRSNLSKLLRFYTLKNPNELISLDQYILNMHKKQEYIYFLAGQEREVLFKSPLLQKLKEKDVDVLLLDDPIDEFCVQNLVEYDKKKLKNVAKKDLKLWDEDEELEKRKFDLIKKHYDVLIKWWKNRLGKQVESIEISKRLVDNPCIIVASEHGYSANMQRISESQAFTNQDKSASSYLYGKKYLEINPNHPAIKTLRQKVMESEKPDTYVEDTADLLFESSLLESGYQLSDIHSFAIKMDRVLKYNLSLDRYATSAELDIKLDDDEEKTEEKPEEAKTEEAKTEETKIEEADININDILNNDFVKIDDAKIETVEEQKHDDL